MQGPKAGAWDLVKDTEKFITDADADKDLVNITDSMTFQILKKAGKLPTTLPS